MALRYTIYSTPSAASMPCKSVTITEDGSFIVTQESVAVGTEDGKADVITNYGHVTARVVVERDAE